MRQRRGTNTGNDYTYDANGNMTADHNKGITAIKYNHLNLPTQITFATSGNISYIYNASGVKVRKVVTEGSTVTTTDYLTGFQYINNKLEFFPHAEGYVKNVIDEDTGFGATNNIYRYVYNYTDHLGNVRLTYTKHPITNVLTILEENNYYPFGLKHRNYNMGKKQYDILVSGGGVEITPTNLTLYDYKYNGKEWQDELGLNFYDYHARNYDPAICRWMNIDPKAEEDRRWTPYRYAYNNPLRFIDPDGMLEDDYLLNDDGSFTLIAETNTPDRVFNDQGNFVELEYDGQINDKVEGTYAGVDYSSITFESDVVAEMAFEFFAINSSVEFSHVQTDDGSFVSTSGESDIESGGAANINSTLSNGGDVLKFNHSHPFQESRNQSITNSSLGVGNSNSYVPGSSEADKASAKSVHQFFPNATLNVFDASSWQYIPFNQNGDIKK